MTSFLFWLGQNLLAVLTARTTRVPEIFMMGLVYRLLTGDRDANVGVIWAAFLGGLLWDLRWVKIPGFFASVYVGAVMMVLWAWNTLPASGRTPGVIFSLFWAAQLFPTILSILVLERGMSGVWTLFGVQQGCAVPLSLLCTFFYFQREKEKNA
jgi:hypothetical protein